MSALVEQKAAIDVAVATANAYIISPEFNNLSTRERQLWQRQTVLLAQLSVVLSERIALSVSV